MRERELKQVVAAGFELRPEQLDVPGAELAGRVGRRVSDSYHDTADLRLARWGVTLRWRDGDGWTVKVPRPCRSGAVLDREEITFDGDRSAPPRDAVALVAPFARGGELVEVARLETDRTARRWQAPDGTVVGELVDDHVVGTSGQGTVSFREIEFELHPDTDLAVLDAVADQLGAGVEPAVPKLVRVLGAAASGPADVVVPPVPEQSTAAEVIHAAVASSVRHLLIHVPAARIGTDPEGVHQTRVAARRLRSDLRTFAPLLDRHWAGDLRRDLRRLAAELGAVRDADVLDGRVAAALATNPEIDPVAGAEVRAHLARERELARAALLDHLDGSDADALFDRLVEAAAAPRLRPRAHRRPAADSLPPLVEGSWERLRRAVDELGPNPADADLHRIRILAKRARYAAEAVAPAAGRDAVRFARSAAAIQDSLGDLHDGVVAADRLARAATGGLSPAGAFAAGRLAQQVRTGTAPARSTWQPHVDRMRRRSRWLRP